MKKLGVALFIMFISIGFVHAQVGAYYNIVKPDIGPDWQVRIQVQFILPMSILKGN